MTTNRKKTVKISIIAVIAVITCLLITACGKEKTPYEINNNEGFTVSVKYDANGGIFTTNTSVIVDSFDMSAASEIALISPDNELRGNDAFSATKNGYFLAGWYKERFENNDGTFSYAGKWDFEKDRLTVDPDAEYSADEPVMTLYAAWVPMFSIEFYNLDNSELISSYTFDPTVSDEIMLPCLDEEKGTYKMFNFPKIDDYTFDSAFFDAEGSKKIEDSSFTHIGVIDYTNGTAVDNTMKLYLKYNEGNWFHIFNVEQFKDNASVSGSYVIHADLDFAEENWPSSFMNGKFKGVINGNGHIFKNINFEQKDSNKDNAGLFGVLTEDAQINDIKFENITFTMKGGARKAGSCFGLFAGRINDGASINNVSITNSILQVDSSCYFATDDYSIGLICGSGDASGIDIAEIGYQPVGDDPDAVSVVVDGYSAVLEEDNN